MSMLDELLEVDALLHASTPTTVIVANDEDLFASVDEIDDALQLQGGLGRRWEIRGEDAVLCAYLPGGVRIEVKPVAVRRCEVRLWVDSAGLRSILEALTRVPSPRSRR